MSMADRIRAAMQRIQPTPADGVEATPPYIQSLVVLSSTVQLHKRLNLLLVCGLGGLIAYQQVQLSKVHSQLRNEDYLVIPGAADFVRVRPNLIPDQAAIDFAHYFVEQMCSITYRNAVSRYDGMAAYMSPALSTALEVELAESLPLLRSIQGAELVEFAGDPVAERTTYNGKPVFRATFSATVHRFAGARRLSSIDEHIEVIYQTAPISGDTPWIFEVIEFSRRSAGEQAEYERAQRLARGGQ